LFPQTQGGGASGYNFEKGANAIIPAGCAGGTIKSGIHFGDSGSAARFFYCAKANRKERTMDGKVDNKHPTVKPISLMQWLCRLITPPNGIVLDPFCGSGSTALACIDENFRFRGIEKDKESFDIACKRIQERLSENKNEFPLFDKEGENKT
jgi:site-specific DNA-methyltransferase (adenine-specific)